MGYKYIVNVYGSTKDKASKYDYETWLEYWDKNNSSPIPETCPVKGCNKKIDGDNQIVGAHVYTCTKDSEKNYTADVEKIFIAPICNSCNITRQGYAVNEINDMRKYDIMQIDEKYLVLKPKYPKKK